jgi:3-oxoacyl-[acyl-carrier protein] reductase
MTVEDARTVLITGASRGIGAAIATRLAASGYDIWLNYHSNHAAAREVQAEIAAAGRCCTLVPFDVGDEASVEGALAPLLEERVPYALVHNAGTARDVVVGMMTTAEWDAVMDVHLRGFFLVTRLLLRAMLPKREGRIVAVASVSGETGQAGQVNYAAAKAGLIGACKALAREVARRNLLVNVVSPGLIDTEMIAGVPLDRILPQIPLGRIGRPEEVAGVVDFLLGKDGSYVTGQVIGINGGLYM